MIRFFLAVVLSIFHVSFCEAQYKRIQQSLSAYMGTVDQSYCLNIYKDSVDYIHPLLMYYLNFVSKKIHPAGNTFEADQIAQSLATLGNYKEAISLDSLLKGENAGELREKMVSIIDANKSHFNRIKIDYHYIGKIRQAVRGKKVVLINEAHDFPAHRSLLFQLLPLFKAIGFSHLAMEALSPMSLSKGIDLSYRTGTYINEPIMGELVRYAKKLGFKLLAYDAVSTINAILRDSVEAYNINDFITHNQNSKVLVLAGYDHINLAAPFPEYFVPMAYLLKNKYRIDLLSIDQVTFSEAGYSYSDGLYRRLCKKFNIAQVGLVTIDSMSNAKIVNAYKANKFDMYLVHPPTKYFHNRPTWCRLHGLRKDVAITLPRQIQQKAILLQAYYDEELAGEFLPAQLIPADQCMISNVVELLFLFPKKTYRIICRDINNKIIYSTKIKS